jgi:heme oxygenase
MRGTVSRQAYIGQLEAYRRVHVAVEEALERSRDQLVRSVYSPSMRRSGDVALDLQALGGTGALPTEVEEVVSRVEARVAGDAGAGLLGRLYVLEGSRRGGLILRRCVQEPLGLSDGELKYFTGYGEGTSQALDGFTERMNAALSGALDEAAAIEGAQRMFADVAEILRTLGDCKLAA